MYQIVHTENVYQTVNYNQMWRFLIKSEINVFAINIMLCYSKFQTTKRKKCS